MVSLASARPAFESETADVEPASPALPKKGTIRREVYDLVAAAGFRGVTDLELTELTKRRSADVQKARMDLLDAGAICDSGQRRAAAPGGEPHSAWMVPHDVDDGATSAPAEANLQRNLLDLVADLPSVHAENGAWIVTCTDGVSMKVPTEASESCVLSAPQGTVIFGALDHDLLVREIDGPFAEAEDIAAAVRKAVSDVHQLLGEVLGLL